MTAHDRTQHGDDRRQPGQGDRPDSRLSIPDPWPTIGSAIEWRITVTMPSGTVVSFDADSEANAFERARRFERSIAYRIERRFVTPWQAVTPDMKTTTEVVERHMVVDPDTRQEHTP